MSGEKVEYIKAFLLIFAIQRKTPIVRKANADKSALERSKRSAHYTENLFSIFISVKQ